SVIKQFSDSFTTDLPSIDILNHGPPNSQLQNIEESQRRRLTQLMRHDRQVDHLRQQRASEAVERRMRAEARERKFQLVRVQKYFDEFVREFRLKKLGKINADEQIFRRFFQQFIQRQKEYLCEIRKLEREEQLEKREEKRKIMETLEHEYRIRLELLNENIKKEREEHSLRMREEQKILKKSKRDLRRRLELNLRQTQEAFLNNKDSAYFREQEAKKLLMNNDNLM
ncbi:unnamed protein product, partial [Heterobilharzia americana]